MPACINCPNYTDSPGHLCNDCSQGTQPSGTESAGSQLAGSQLAGNVITDLVRKVRRTTKALIFGPQDLSQTARNFLKRYGGQQIIKAELQRQPVNKAITETLNLITLGQLNQSIDNSPFDKLFHLSILFTLQNGQVVRVEKNEVITFTIQRAPPAKAETLAIPDFPQKTLNEAIQATKQHMGSKFAPYQSSTNNCQRFIRSILHANGLQNQEYDSWVLQPTSQIFKDSPYLRPFNNIITGLGARVSTLVQGAGTKPKRLRPKPRRQSSPDIPEPVVVNL